MGNKTGKIKPLFILFCFLVIVKQTEGYHQRFLNPSLRCHITGHQIYRSWSDFGLVRYSWKSKKRPKEQGDAAAD